MVVVVVAVVAVVVAVTKWASRTRRFVCECQVGKKEVLQRCVPSGLGSMAKEMANVSWVVGGGRLLFCRDEPFEKRL